MAPLAHYLRRYPRVAVEWLLHDGTPNFISDGIDFQPTLPKSDRLLVRRLGHASQKWRSKRIHKQTII